MVLTMTVQHLIISAADDQVRLDRWLRARFNLPQGRIQKLLRTGQVRVNKGRVQAGHLLQAGDNVRVPPLGEAASDVNRAPKGEKPLTKQDLAFIQELVLEESPNFYVLNKPQGLAVQGGTKTRAHIDRLLPGLKASEAEDTPRLVHRLDKDTSGLLIVARSAESARWLTGSFKDRLIQKKYLGICVGRPKKKQGIVTLPLSKRQTPQGEKIVVDTGPEGRKAKTHYRVLHYAELDNLSVVELTPETGRMHQLRVHCASLGCPLLGDGKYGAAEAHPFGRKSTLHLHAWQLDFDDPDGNKHRFKAPIPSHFQIILERIGYPLSKV